MGALQAGSLEEAKTLQEVQERAQSRHLAQQLALVRSTHKTCASVCMRLRSLKTRVSAGIEAQAHAIATQNSDKSATIVPPRVGRMSSRSRNTTTVEEVKTTRRQRKRKPSARAASAISQKNNRATTGSSRSRSRASTVTTPRATANTRKSTRNNTRSRSSSRKQVQTKKKKETKVKKSKLPAGFDSKYPLVKVRCKCAGAVTRVLEHCVRRDIHFIP